MSCLKKIQIQVYHEINFAINTPHEGAFYQLFVLLSSATSFEPISGNIDVPLG